MSFGNNILRIGVIFCIWLPFYILGIYFNNVQVALFVGFMGGLVVMFIQDLLEYQGILESGKYK